MKKLGLLLMVCMFMVAGAMAQSSYKTSGGLTYDTLTNAETLYLTIAGVQDYDRLMGVIVYADTLSGTTGKVVAQPEVWLDDITGWAPLGDPVTVIDTVGGSVSVAEASKTFTFDRMYFLKYRMAFTQTGTATTLVKASAFFRARYR